MFCIFPAVRHEEVPGKREPRTEESVPGPPSPRVPVSQRDRFCQIRIRTARLSHLGTDHQRSRYGYAQV